jgi:hypothetical protein
MSSFFIGMAIGVVMGSLTVSILCALALIDATEDA